MTKALYQEALADLRKFKELAEVNAQRAVLDVVAPRIGQFIENALLGEDVGEGDDRDPASGTLSDVVNAAASDDLPLNPEDQTAAISPPDEEGKVTLDIDALEPTPEGEYELNAESITALKPLVTAAASVQSNKLVERTNSLVERVNSLVRLSKKGALKSLSTQIVEMITTVGDTYDHVQESNFDPAIKATLEASLEGCYVNLQSLQEKTMRNGKVNEADVTLKLTGLPDDVDLESVGVDLVTDDDDVEAGAPEGEDLGGDEGGDDLDLDNLDLGGGDEGGVKGEGFNLSDDTIVEIDATTARALRQEIAKRRRLKEENKPWKTTGNGVSNAVIDDFGGGSDEGDGLEQDIVDQTPAKAALPLGEGEDDDMEPMQEIGDERTRDALGASQTTVPTVDKNNPAARTEAIKRRLSAEKRIQEAAKSAARRLRIEIANARVAGNVKKSRSLVENYNTYVRKFNDSVGRTQRLNTMLSEQKNLSTNGRSQRSAVDANNYRDKLAETNLVNAKLAYTNKLLQTEGMTARQKARVIEVLDGVQSVREAKLVYETLQKALVNSARSINESTNDGVRGSSSRPTRSGSAQTLTEGFETARWQKLAGLK